MFKHLQGTLFQRNLCTLKGSMDMYKSGRMADVSDQYKYCKANIWS